MCRHQIGFIAFFSQCDYRTAAVILAGNALAASRLLRAQCLLELADYTGTMELLQSELKSRRRPRRTLSYGKVKRVETQLFTRLFRVEEALAAADEAEECSKYSTYYLAHANVLENKALAISTLKGDFDDAIRLLNRSIQLAVRAPHAPTHSWSLQSLALIQALRGSTELVEPTLEKSESLFTNPNQGRRSRLIRVLVRELEKDGKDSLIIDYEALREEYKIAGQSWYASLISLLLERLRGGQVSEEEIRQSFGEEVNVSGLLQSAFMRIIATR